MTIKDSLKRFKVDKLVRDKIPDIMKDKNIIAHKRIMENDEFVARLKEKLFEESQEVQESQTREQLAEELADLIEIIDCLAKNHHLSMEEIEKIRMLKREVKGSFEKRYYNSFIDVENSNPAIEHYLARPNQYPLVENPPYDSECIFCQIAHQKKEADIIAKFRHCFVMKDRYPVSKGHALIIPYEHTENWFTARKEIQQDIFQALNQTKLILDSEYQPDGYNIGANCGEKAGQTVMHLHVHLIPRYQGDMEDPKGGVRGVIPSKQKY